MRLFAAFKIIREAYYQQLETRGDKTDPELSSWLEWREKNRPSKPLLVSVNRPPQSFSLSSASGRGGGVKAPAQPLSAASPAAPQAAPAVAPVSKQAVVLPTRPLPVTNTSTSMTNAGATGGVKLPTSPVITGGGGVSSLPLGRTIATTTLTAAQLQQLAAARGQVFVSGLGTQVRTQAGAGAGSSVRQVTAQLARGGQIVRQAGQTSLIVSQQPRQALAVQRPLVSGQVVARSVRPGGGPGQQIMVAASPRPGTPGQQIMVGGRGVGGQLVMASAGQLRQGGVMVVTTTAGAGSGGVIMASSTTGATRQHYVISGSQAGGQIVALQPGQNIRQGQIVQVSLSQSVVSVSSDLNINGSAGCQSAGTAPDRGVQQWPDRAAATNFQTIIKTAALQ